MKAIINYQRALKTDSVVYFKWVIISEKNTVINIQISRRHER